MSATFQSWPTKLAALLIGLALGVAGSKDQPAAPATLPPPAEASRPDSQRPRPTADRAPRVSDSTRAPAAQPTEAYAAAWESLKDGKLPRAERLELQRRLLAEWAAIDLESALHAAFADPENRTDDPFAPTISDAWSGALWNQLDLAWELIQKRTFGPRTAELRQTWIEAKADSDPLGLLSHFDDLPPWRGGSPLGTSREGAIISSLGSAHASGADPALGPAVLHQLLALPADQGGSWANYVAKEYLPHQSPDILAQGITHATDPAVREIYLDALVTRLQLRGESAETELEQIVPAHLRAEVEAELRARGDH